MSLPAGSNVRTERPFCLPPPFQDGSGGPARSIPVKTFAVLMVDFLGLALGGTLKFPGLFGIFPSPSFLLILHDETSD